MLTKSRSAFTLIETLIVATIVIVVSVAGFVGLAQYRNKQALESGLGELRAAVENAKRQSVTQEQRSRWGVRLTNATSGVSSYTTFRGASYSTSGVDRTYSFRGSLGFGNPSASSTYDLLFSPLTGALSENKVVTLVGSGKGLIGDLILRTVGSITARTDKDVVGYWHLDEGTSTSTADASGNANTGTLTNGPTWQSGSSCKAGSCLSFNGTNHYISIADSTSLRPSALTVSVWVKTSATTQTGCVVAKQLGASTNNSYALYANAGKMTICVGPSGGSCAGSSDPSNLPSDTWSHFSGVFDGSNTYLYKNGAQIDTDVWAITVGYDANPVHVGADSNDSVSAPETCWFNGSIDEVRIYNRALSATEILSQYNDLK